MTHQLAAPFVPDDWSKPESWPPGELGWPELPFWPRPGLRRVPPTTTAKGLACTVGDWGDDARDPVALTAWLGLRVRERPLGAREGGLEAALLPDFGHTFEILVDPWVPPDDPDRVRFRIAHELAHTLFYNWLSDPPKKLREDSLDEEEFCDTFASALLGARERRKAT